MADVQFEEQFPTSYTSSYYQRTKGGLIGLLIKWGLADDEAGAIRCMLWIIAACILISTTTIFIVNYESAGKQLTKKQVERIMRLQPRQ